MEGDLAGLWFAQWHAWQPPRAAPDLARFLADRTFAKPLVIGLHATVSSDPSFLNLIIRIGRDRRMRLLGEGAFGFVWLGMDEKLHHRVAIKVPTPNISKFAKRLRHVTR